MEGKEYPITKEGFQFLQREPDEEPFIGEWRAPGTPPRASHILNDLRKESIYSIRALKAALRPKRYGENVLLVGYGVNNLFVENGTVVLGGVWDCLGMLCQYETQNGDTFVRAAHLDMVGGYNEYSVLNFLDSVALDSPRSIRFGIYGNERTIYSIRNPYITTLSRDIQTYAGLIQSMVPTLEELMIEVNMGAQQPERMGSNTFAVASTSERGGLGSRTFKIDTKEFIRSLKW